MSYTIYLLDKLQCQYHNNIIEYFSHDITLMPFLYNLHKCQSYLNSQQSHHGRGHIDPVSMWRIIVGELDASQP